MISRFSPHPNLWGARHLPSLISLNAAETISNSLSSTSVNGPNVVSLSVLPCGPAGGSMPDRFSNLPGSWSCGIGTDQQILIQRVAHQRFTRLIQRHLIECPGADVFLTLLKARSGSCNKEHSKYCWSMRLAATSEFHPQCSETPYRLLRKQTGGGRKRDDQKIIG